MIVDSEVLVIGAGPAGTAAACTLARAGVDVVLADREPFPRDKVCGDALIPDALQALDELGLRRSVLEASRELRSMRIYSPDGTCVTLDGEFACVKRFDLDRLLLETAVDAGARFLAPAKLKEARVHDAAITGAWFSDGPSGGETEVTARVTILATGAHPGPLETFEVGTRPTASAMAARCYATAPAATDHVPDALMISYDRSICPGYGWVFPGPNGSYNVGVAFFRDSRRRPASSNLRDLFRRFGEEFEPAREVLTRAESVTALKGAPLRTGLQGSAFHRRGLLVAGEAAGTTYSFSGEGIGKAMESGILAARTVLEHRDSGADPAECGSAYETVLRERFEDRFEGYRKAQRWLSSPRFCDLLARRAKHGKYLQEQLEGIINETTDPLDIFSFRGLVRSLLR